ASNTVISVLDQSSASHFSVRQGGDIYSTGKAEYSQASRPTVSSCGTGLPTVNSSTDQAGIITTGGGSVTSCTVTFATAFKHIPACTVTGEATGAVVLSISAKSASAI